jgi:hypothetical protein
MSAQDKFIGVGENIHCTRIYKVGGKYVKDSGSGGYAIFYTVDGESKSLPIPEEFTKKQDWENGKVKHTAVAIWQGVYGSGDVVNAGKEYIHYMAKEQIAKGASFLDLNVDEFSTDNDEKVKLMKWAAEVVQEAATIPLSVDSSNPEIMQAGLASCSKSLGQPMVNSVSLEREDLIPIAKNAGASVIAGATGKDKMPDTVDERVSNMDELVKILTSTGFDLSEIYLDPLVFPVSVNSQNGNNVLDAIKQLRGKYGSDIHFAPGLSNISFGLPKRKLINQVFTYLCAEEGCDGGIVDPVQINENVLKNMDTGSESFKIAKALLVGEDDYGMNYIAAVRAGTI